ncbi:ABC transporter permease [Bacteroides sp. 214]|uniref:ABC transporter permease n=1 Tax=Bacteroides sp. 214 TaxID=2302935 RepID=UPI0013D2709C|nr:FtsX-like permease family protein [Bacteroides sp. 214]NDW13580.1 ABC transporter permease [Bacteroides sp. 214]
MIKHYLTVAFRNVFKHKAQSIISVLGLVAGLFCFTTTNYYARALYRGDEVFPKFERMAKLHLKYGESPHLMAPTRDVPAGKEDIDQVLALDLHEVEYAAQYSTPTRYNITISGEDGEELLYYTTAMNANVNFIKMYPSKFLEGSEQLCTSRPRSALITQSFLRTLGFQESVVGKTFTVVSRFDADLEPQQVYTIAGVIADYPGYANFTLFNRKVDIILLNDDCNEATFMLKEKIKLSELNDRLQSLQVKSWQGQYSNLIIDYIKDQRRVPIQLMIIGFIGFLVMLSGVINFLTFSIGSFINRNRELSLRKTVGANNVHFFILLFTELAIIVIIAVFVLVPISEVFYPYLYSLLPTEFQFFFIDAHEAMIHNIEYGLIILLICAVVAFIAVVRIKLSKTLMIMRRGNSTGRKHRLRNMMLGFQLFIAIIFLIAVGTCISQSYSLSGEYETHVGGKDAQRDIELRLYKDFVLRKNGENIIQFVQSKDWAEVVGGIKHDLVDFEQGEYSYGVSIGSVTPGYATFTGYKELKEVLSRDEYFCLVNDKLKRLLERDSTMNGVPGNHGMFYPVTGTVKMEEGKNYTAYVPFTEGLLSVIHIRVKPTADINEAIKELSAFMQEFLPVNFDLPIQTTTESNNHIVFLFNILLRVFAICAIVCILISILGIYGAISLDTERRQKEIAIRKINGASIKYIYWLFGKLYITIYVLAVFFAGVIGWFVIYLMSINQKFFKIVLNPNDPLLWLGVLFTSALIVFFTVYYRIRCISQLNPADIIKND